MKLIAATIHDDRDQPHTQTAHTGPANRREWLAAGMTKRAANRAPAQYVDGTNRPSRLGLALWLLDDRCPVCDYDLSGQDPQADGASVCPECGAAWILALWREDHQPPSESALPRGTSRPSLDARHRPTRVRVPLLTSAQSALALRKAALTMLLPIGVGIALLAVTYAMSRNRDSWWFFALWLAAAVAAYTLVTGLLTRRVWLRKQREAALLEEILSGQCPSCTGALRERPAISDGALLCESCHAAWSVVDPPSLA